MSRRSAPSHHGHRLDSQYPHGHYQDNKAISYKLACGLFALLATWLLGGEFLRVLIVVCLIIFGAVLAVAQLVGAIYRSWSKAAAAHRRRRRQAQAPQPRVAFQRRKLVSGQRCPYCHDSLSGEEGPTCQGCNAAYHDECLLEARGCVTLGCAHAAPRRSVRA